MPLSYNPPTPPTPPLSTSAHLCPQVHVLSYSLHALLCGLSQDLASGDLDPCLQSISDIVAEDLFGQLAEEREVPEAVSKLPEAKSSKGLATLEIVSSKLSPQLLPSLIAPLKKVGAVCASVFAMGSTTLCCWVLSLIRDTVLLHHPFASRFLCALLMSLCSALLSCPCLSVSRLLKAAPMPSFLIKLRKHCVVCHLVFRAMRVLARIICFCSYMILCLTVSPNSPAVMRGGEGQGRVEEGEEWRAGGGLGGEQSGGEEHIGDDLVCNVWGWWEKGWLVREGS